MTPATFAADIDVAARYVEAGTLLLRLVTHRLAGDQGHGDAGMRLSALLA